MPFIGACWRLRTVITGTVLCAPERFRLVAPFESDHFRLEPTNRELMAIRVSNGACPHLLWSKQMPPTRVCL